MTRLKKIVGHNYLNIPRGFCLCESHQETIKMQMEIKWIGIICCQKDSMIISGLIFLSNLIISWYILFVFFSGLMKFIIPYLVSLSGLKDASWSTFMLLFQKYLQELIIEIIKNTWRCKFSFGAVKDWFAIYINTWN